MKYTRGREEIFLNYDIKDNSGIRHFCSKTYSLLGQLWCVTALDQVWTFVRRQQNTVPLERHQAMDTSGRWATTPQPGQRGAFQLFCREMLVMASPNAPEVYKPAAGSTATLKSQLVCSWTCSFPAAIREQRHCHPAGLRGLEEPTSHWCPELLQWSRWHCSCE